MIDEGEIHFGEHTFKVKGDFQMYTGESTERLDKLLVTRANQWMPFDGWPYYLYCYYLRDAKLVQHSDLWAPGMPYYPSEYDLLFDTMGLRRETIFMQSVTVSIPHLKARSADVTVNSKGFHVQIERKNIQADSLLVHYYAKTQEMPSGTTGTASPSVDDELDVSRVYRQHIWDS